MPAKYRFVIYTVLLIDVYSGSFSPMGFWSHLYSHSVYMSFYCVHTITEIFGYKLDSESSPWLEIPCLIALTHVDLTGLNAAACRYSTKSVWFVMCYALLILCSMSLRSFGLLFSKDNIHNPVIFLLVPVMIIFSSLMMWTFLCVNTDFNPTPHILLMEINELCISPARIWNYLSILVSCGNENVYYLVNMIVPPFGSPTVIYFRCFLFMGVAWFM